MAVRDWIKGFLKDHKARFDPNDWPVDDATEELAEFVRGWVTAFNLKEVSEEEAKTASRRLVLNPPSWRREHIPMVVAAVMDIRAERNRSQGIAPGGTLEASRRASRQCPHCCGDGLTSVYHPWPSVEHRIAPTAAAYCVCPAGRHIKKIHAEQDADLLRHIVDFDHVLNGASVYLAEHPSVAGIVAPEVDPFSSGNVA